MKTIKSDGSEEFIPMSCLTIPISELGTFLKMDDVALVDVLVDLWDGQLTSWGHATKTSGEIIIKNPWLNIMGCTTPSWLKANFPEHMIGGGLASRIIFVYGEAKAKLVAYPDEFTPDAQYRDLEGKLVDDLKDIGLMSGEFKLSPEARAWGHIWYKDHWTKDRPTHMASDRYGGYLARKQTHIHKVALVLSAAEGGSMVIEKLHLEMAEQLLLSVEPHMMKVFDSIGTVEESRHTHEILPFIKAFGFLTADDLWKKVMNLMTQKDFAEAISAAHRGGLIRVADVNGKKGLVIATPLSSLS